MLAGRKLKAVFALGAGVDSILSKLNAHPEMLDASIPLFRLEDTGMGLQMQEYAVSQVLHWFRRFDDYQALKNQAKWQPLPEYTHEEFTVGIMGQVYWAQSCRKPAKHGDSHCAAGAVRVNPGLAWKASPVLRNWARF